MAVNKDTFFLFIDVHECTFGPHNCSARFVCTNSEGIFKADCIFGYPWNGLNSSGKRNLSSMRCDAEISRSDGDNLSPD